jgi:hypothetical protein
MRFRYHGEQVSGGGMLDRRERVIVRREPVEDKTCQVCERTFEGLRRQSYCSINCANRASYARHAEKRRAEKREEYRRKVQEGRTE